jgi:hypothetical protein
MKVLDLRCSAQHRFEGWFASDADYESQLKRQLVACPLCGVTDVSRVPSAPRLNLSGASAPAAQAGTDTSQAPQQASQQMQGRWLQALRKVLENTENVGDRFAEEARRIHYSEAPARQIRGVASLDEAQALAEEGIDVMPLPIPAALKEPLQ